MRIDSEQLAPALARGLQDLYVLVGFEPLLALEAADRIRAAARAAGHTERQVATVESGFDWTAFDAGARNVSLFAQQRLVELRIPGGKAGNEGARSLERYAKALPADTITLVDLPAPERAVLQTKWFGALEQAGCVVTANAIGRERLEPWIAGRLAAQGQQADEAVLALLADQVEGNLLAAWQEIQKLGLLFPKGRLRQEDIRQAVLDVARFDVFELGDAALAGDAARAARMLRGLEAEGEPAPLVLWSLVEPLRVAMRVRAAIAQRKPPAQALRESRVFGPRQGLIERTARRLDDTRAAGLLRLAAQVDRTIKGLERGDPWEGLLALALGIAGEPLP